IDSSTNEVRDRTSYVYRHSLHTRARLLSRQGQISMALSTIDRVLKHASDAADQLLVHTAMLDKAELILKAGDRPTFLSLIGSLGSDLAKVGPDLVAHYERIVGSAFARCGDVANAVSHFNRS